MRLGVLVGLIVCALLGTLVLLVRDAEQGLEILAVALLVGLLVIRELMSASATRAFRGRFDIFVWSGIAVFTLIVVNRVRHILRL